MQICSEEILTFSLISFHFKEAAQVGKSKDQYTMAGPLLQWMNNFPSTL